MRWLVVALAVGACAKSSSKPAPKGEPADCPPPYAAPEIEVAADPVPLDLPAVPAFTVPPINPDGSRSVRELRVAGNRLLETEVTVRGFVTWVYDCFEVTRADPRNAGVADDQLRRLIADDPTRCARRYLRLADGAVTGLNHAIHVVDLPADLAVKGGDELVVTGTWTTRSPHGDARPDGLLVFAKTR